jgi:hypothetical protein
MVRFVAIVVSAFLAVSHVAAFTSPKPSSLIRHRPSTPFSISYGGSTKALNLKVKVDPDAAKKKNALGNAKMAAYGGSVAIAILLPVIFLVWSALK